VNQEVWALRKLAAETAHNGLFGPAAALAFQADRQPNPAAEMFQNLSRYFDWVLLDRQPLLSLTDTVALSRVVDGTLMVVKAAHTSRKAPEHSHLPHSQYDRAYGCHVRSNSDLSRPQRYFWWTLSVFWAVQMFHLSTESFGHQYSGSMLVTLFESLGIDLSHVTIDTLNTLLRKAAHIFEYAVLGFLLYRSLQASQALIWNRTIAGITLCLAAAYAMLDEFHQSFVPTRHASVMDWGVDLAGCSLALLLLYRVTQHVSEEANH
jgi:VanZ family protein